MKISAKRTVSRLPYTISLGKNYSQELPTVNRYRNISPGLYIISVKDEKGQIISVSKLIKN